MNEKSNPTTTTTGQKRQKQRKVFVSIDDNDDDDEEVMSLDLCIRIITDGLKWWSIETDDHFSELFDEETEMALSRLA